MDYVGNVFTENDLQMSKKKIQVVLDFPIQCKKNSNVRLVWTPSLITSFNLLKEAISNCTTLYFLNDTAHNIAFDYGIGGYLFQTIGDNDKPIAFISKNTNVKSLKFRVSQLGH